jgi:glutamyl-tRNA reductase
MTRPMSPSVPQFSVIGANHRSASLSLREGMFVDDAAVPAVLADLAARGVDEALVLSTCDRVEVWAAGFDADQARAAAVAVLARRVGLEDAVLAPQLYGLNGVEAVRHVFAVTASLDSLIVGEPHILGQVKAAQRLARDAGHCRGALEAIVQAAFSAAKRVRNETAVGEGPVSIAAAAVQLARDLHGDLARCHTLMVGAGDMGELVAESLLAAGLGRVSVTAPRLSRAEALAQSLGAHVVPFEDLREALIGADIVLAAVGGRTRVVTAEAITQALRKRRRRPMFLIDAGIPGDIEPAVNRIEGVFLYDLADLEQVALKGRATREHAARTAAALVDEELAVFLRGRAARAAVPAIVALRQRFEDTREAVLAEVGLADGATATRLLIHRLLHAPSEAMKDVAAEGEEWREMERTLRHLFRLDPAAPSR